MHTHTIQNDSNHGEFLKNQTQKINKRKDARNKTNA